MLKNPRCGDCEIQGPDEVFVGETVSVQVRFHIQGFHDRRWHLILDHEGEEIDRRTVWGRGGWQQEQFEFPAQDAGLQKLSAVCSRCLKM